MSTRGDIIKTTTVLHPPDDNWYARGSVQLLLLVLLVLLVLFFLQLLLPLLLPWQMLRPDIVGFCVHDMRRRGSVIFTSLWLGCREHVFAEELSGNSRARELDIVSIWCSLSLRYFRGQYFT